MLISPVEPAKVTGDHSVYARTSQTVLAVFRHYPLTLLMVCLVVVAALVTHSRTSGLDQSRFRDLGYAPLHLRELQVYRIATSTFLTNNFSTLCIATVMLCICVASAERLFGSAQAMAIFWGCHASTLVATSLITNIFQNSLNDYLGMLLTEAHDVGPSAGYYGCLGATCIFLPNRLRWIALSGIAVLLIARLSLSLYEFPLLGQTINADLAHAVAFTIGLIVGAITTIRSRHRATRIAMP